MPTDRFLGWLAPLVITLFAGVLRFYRLTSPPAFLHGKVNYTFDEVYYTVDAHSLLRFGVETGAHCGQGVDIAPPPVHPPLGKWMMAAGEQLFGYIDCAGHPHGNPALGWRFSAAVCGTLAVLILARTARRMFRSTLLGCIAGLLLALDGLEFVQSRTGILDIFLMFWIVAALACLVCDRDWGRDRLAAGRRLGLWRPWRLAGGVCLGAAMSVKWSALWAIVALSALAFAWDVGARRIAAGQRALAAADAGEPPRRGHARLGAWPTMWRRDFPGWVLTMLAVPLIVYTATYIGWFTTSIAYMREDYGGGFLGSLRAWWHWHFWAIHFHTQLSARHPYQSDSPFQWMVLGRPVAFAYQGTKFGQDGCPYPGGCSQEVLDLGNPAIWWVSIGALVGCAWLWLRPRDWRAALVLVGFGLNFLPWLVFGERTKFLFYALPLLPFLVLGLTMMAGLALGPPDAPVRRRMIGAAAVGGYLVAVLVLFAYFYPIWAYQLISYRDWLSHMWFTSWI